jgi:hypothetical protein
MNPLLGELRNPFKNGKVIGADISPAVYHRENARRGQKDLVMGRSALMEVLHNPHRWVMGFEPKDSDATAFGSLMDCKVLSPADFPTRFAVKPAQYPDEKGQMKDWHGGSNWCKQWIKEHIGQEHVSAQAQQESDQAVEYLLKDPAAGEFVRCSQKQVMVMAEYHDPETKLVIPVKTLIDLLPDKGHPEFGRDMGDYKTSANAHPFAWGRDVKKYNYHVQGAFYLDVYEAAVPQERLQFRHVIQENFFPWEVGRRYLTEDFLERGRLRYLEALQLYAQCLATGEWVGYERPRENAVVIRGWLQTDPEPWM